ncbi:MAG: cellulose-binding protein [Firmicutes bacterium]|nr:cellulose-binding protein [Bacillota bacterium]
MLFKWPPLAGAAATLSFSAVAFMGTTHGVRIPVNIAIRPQPHGVVVSPIAIGVNASAYDRDLQAMALPLLLRRAGVALIRFPGGSLADQYDWQTNTDVVARQPEAVTFNQFVHLVDQAGATAMITVNYGSGAVIGRQTHITGAELAAQWVSYANRVHHDRIRYWEIGNEVYGNGTYGFNWETDDHCHTVNGERVNLTNEPSQTYGCGPLAYAENAKRYIDAMKAADPRITIGIVLTAAGAPNNWPNNVTNTQSPATWNQTVLSTLGSAIGFADIHWYPQNPSSVIPPGPSNAGLLNSTREIPRAVATLRHEFAAWAHDPHLPIMVTETNSVSSNPGHQTLSVVNALFLDQDYLTWLENGVVNVDWWQIHNGLVTTGDNGATNEIGQPISGNARYGDYGLLSNGSCGTTPSGARVCEPPAETPFSSYDGLLMLHHMLQAGDVFLDTVASHSWVQAFAVLNPRLHIVHLLVVNDSPTVADMLHVEMCGYSIRNTASAWVYGPDPTGIKRLVGFDAVRRAMTFLAPYSEMLLTLSHDNP